MAGLLQEAEDANSRAAPYPKCELNIISFVTLLHPLHCPIFAKNIMVTLLLIQVMGNGKVVG